MAEELNVNFNPKAMQHMLSSAATGDNTVLGEGVKEILLTRCQIKQEKEARKVQLD